MKLIPPEYEGEMAALIQIYGRRQTVTEWRRVWITEVFEIARTTPETDVMQEAIKRLAQTRAVRAATQKLLS